MNRFLISIFFLLFTITYSNADIVENIKVRLFSTYNGNKAIISVAKGDYFLLANDVKGKLIDTIAKVSSLDKESNTVYFSLKSGKISLLHDNRNLGSFDKVYFVAVQDTSSFVIRYESQKERFYEGSLLMSPKNNNLEIVNKVGLDSYVAGVVESEVGSKGNLEFYKAQAIIARTYAIKNLNKFISNGYNLTDDVRSQVYFSKSYYVENNLILKAVEETKSKVIVDFNNRLILPVFHANSGGQTSNAKEVWVTDLPYLKSKRDPYSTTSPGDSTFWEVEIPKDRFLLYFNKRAPEFKNNSKYYNAILSFKQEQRKSHLSYRNVKIPLKEIRSQFKLRSTFFDISDRGDKVLISGKGYGHGVGLSQIGAIHMAERGYTYDQIIKFYYHNVKVVDYKEVI
ncbi:MAG: SpoIID/LytB domain-containing protein [Bacteroidota bacterium]